MLNLKKLNFSPVCHSDVARILGSGELKPKGGDSAERERISAHCRLNLVSGLKISTGGTSATEARVYTYITGLSRTKWLNQIAIEN